MKKFIIILGLLISFLFSTTFANKFDFQKYFGFAIGDKKEKVIAGLARRNLSLVCSYNNSNKRDYYISKNQKDSFDGIEIENIVFKFDRNKLNEITLLFDALDWNKILRIMYDLKFRFANSSFDNPYTNNFALFFDNCNIWIMNSSDTKGMLFQLPNKKKRK